MAYINYSNASPYAGTSQAEWHIGRYQHRKIFPAGDDEYMTVEPKYHNRPDLLAYDLYGNPQYWWVFCARNMDSIRDPIWDFVSGLEIVVPSKKNLKATLG